MLLSFVPTFRLPIRKDMNERNKKTNFMPGRRDRSAAEAVYMRSAGYALRFCASGYPSADGYTGGLFTYGRSYRSQAA